MSRAAGSGPLGYLQSIVTATIFQDMLEHFMVNSADKPNADADSIIKMNKRDTTTNNADEPTAAIKATWALLIPPTV